MQYFFGFLFFLFGAILGSFVNVVVSRYNTGLSFLSGYSICFSCGEDLKKKDLFPIFSFLFLKGNCRYCSSKIPKNVFWTEVTMGVLSFLAFLKSGLNSPDLVFTIYNSYFIIHFLNYLLLVLIFSVVLAISLYDLKHFIIPDGFLIALFIFSFFYNFSFSIIDNSFSYLSIFTSLLSGIVLTSPFFIIFLISKGIWFGFGDIKYIAVLGFLLGLTTGISAVSLAFWIGAIFAVFLLIFQKIIPHFKLPLFRKGLTMKSEIPFGPFLSLGLIIGLLLNLDFFHIYDLFIF